MFFSNQDDEEPRGGGGGGASSSSSTTNTTRARTQNEYESGSREMDLDSTSNSLVRSPSFELTLHLRKKQSELKKVTKKMHRLYHLLHNPQRLRNRLN